MREHVESDRSYYFSWCLVFIARRREPCRSAVSLTSTLTYASSCPVTMIYSLFYNISRKFWVSSHIFAIGKTQSFYVLLDLLSLVLTCLSWSRSLIQGVADHTKSMCSWDFFWHVFLWNIWSNWLAMHLIGIISDNDSDSDDSGSLFHRESLNSSRYHFITW